MSAVTILDNKNLEHKLTFGKQYEVKGESTGDFYDYYLLLCDDGKQHWVEQYRACKFVTPFTVEGDYPNSKDYEHLYKRNSGAALPYDFPCIKSLSKAKAERIICIPDEDGHIVDLQRVQCISPINKSGGISSYKVTLVSGWEMKLTDEVYSREKLIGLWKGLQNK